MDILSWTFQAGSSHDTRYAARSTPLAPSTACKIQGPRCVVKGLRSIASSAWAPLVEAPAPGTAGKTAALSFRALAHSLSFSDPAL